MFNKMSIRVRVTIITTLLLIICCVGLTFVLNRSAFKMADSVEIYKLNPNEKSKLESSQDDLTQFRLYNNDTNENEEDIIPNSKTIEAKHEYEYSSLIYMFVFIILGGILTYFIMGKNLKPLNELAKQMKNKSLQNLSEEISIGKREDEIYNLTLSFNNMTKKLNESFLMQKRFSNSAAHELRTPLAVMRTKLDVFKKRKNTSEEEYDKLIESMRNQLIRLSDIVNSLLSLTNMEDMDLTQGICLKSLIKSVCNDLYAIAENKNIKIKIIGEEINITGNYDLIYRAFYNLVENSIKYNYENGSVNINIKNEKDAIVTIEDSGVGIPDDMKDQVFEAFFRIDKSRSRNLGGAGIGLSIVKSVIEKHKGNISIANNKIKGTIFTIKLKKQVEC